MPKKEYAPFSLYESGREYLKEQERKNEILAEIAGVSYEPPGDIPSGKYVIEKRMLDAAQKENELLEDIAEVGGSGGGANKLAIDYATDVVSLKKNDTAIADSGVTLPAYGLNYNSSTGGLTLTKNGTGMQGQTVALPAKQALETAQEAVQIANNAVSTASTAAVAAVPTVVTGWLGDHVDPETGYVIDNSLSIADAAADAKAAGDKIASVESALEKTCKVEAKTYTLYVSSNKYYYFDSTALKFVVSSSEKFLSTRYVNNLNSIIAFDLRSNDIKYTVRYFDETGEASTSSSTGYLGQTGYKTGLQLLPKEAKRFVFVFQRVDGEAISSEDQTTIMSNLYAYYSVDTTLSVANVPADAAAVGEVRDTADRNVQKLYEETITPTWEDGGINSTTAPGANTSDYNGVRIRCAYTTFANGLEVTVPSGMTARICVYTPAGGSSGFIKWLDDGFWTGTKFFNCPPGTYFRIQAQYDPSASILPSAGASITIKRFSFTAPIINIPANSDLNSYTTPGIYYSQNTSVTASLSNCPIKTTSFRLDVEEARYNGAGQIRQTIKKAEGEQDGFWVRYYGGSSFSKWDHYIPTRGIFTPQIVYPNVKTYDARTNAPVKARYRIGEYNVAHYRMSQENYDYLSGHADSINKWRRWVQNADLDFLFLCEDSQYIDSAQTMSSSAYLYNPYFDENNSILHGHRILTRTGLTTAPLTGLAVPNVNTSPGAYQNYWIDWIIVSPENVGNILMAVIHNFPSGPNAIGTEAQVKENRANYYAAIKGLLEDQAGNYDYVIIAGDTNVGNYASPTTANREYDMNLIETMCEETDTHLVNGDEIGWFKTVPSHMNSNYVYDNIIVSNNIRVEKIECNPFAYEDLYSDHVPVIAELSLLS